MSIFGIFAICALFSLALANAGQYTTCSSCTGANQNIFATYCWNTLVNPPACQSGVLGICPSGATLQPYNCPVDPPAAFPYTDDFGRNKALPFLAANYANTTAQAQSCIDSHSNNLPGVTVIRRYDQANCSVILAVNNGDKAIVVSFRGSVGLEQFLLLGLNLFLGPQVPFLGGTVYAYYGNCFAQLLAGGLGAGIAAQKSANPSYELWSFGHSLGGSLASMTAAYAVSTGVFTSDKVKELTTGQTRAGNLAYAQSHDNLVPNAYRIVNQGDWITKLPLKLSIYNDAGSYHHRHEVWYPTSMAVGSSFTVYNQAEDPNGSDSQGVDLSDNSHNAYYNVPLDTWVNTNCQ